MSISQSQGIQSKHQQFLVVFVAVGKEIWLFFNQQKRKRTNKHTQHTMLYVTTYSLVYKSYCVTSLRTQYVLAIVTVWQKDQLYHSVFRKRPFHTWLVDLWQSVSLLNKKIIKNKLLKVRASVYQKSN